MRLRDLTGFCLGATFGIVVALTAYNAHAKERTEEISPGVSFYASTNNVIKTKSLSLRVEVLDSPGACSGTIVGPRMIFTAAHCFADAGEPVTFVLTTQGGSGDKIIVRSKEIISDGSDHAFVILDSDKPIFRHWARLGPDLVEGQNFEYYGNPNGLPGTYRRGYVSKNYELGVFLDVNGFHGDSGAGLFDERGRLVGMISTINGALNPSGLSIKFMQSFFFTYDRAKWSRITPELGSPCQGCRTPV